MWIPSLPRLLAPVVLLALGAAPAPAQTQPPPDLLLRGTTADNGFGAAVALAGDVNGDGERDLLIGAEAFDDQAVAQGRAYLFYGPFTHDLNLNDADATITGEALLDGLGNAVAGAGDVNGDGFDDVLVGARSNDTAGTQAGRAYLFYGPLSGDLDALDADAVISGDPFDELGWSVAGAGDVDGDGLDDVLVGAWMAGAGKAALFYGPLSGALSIGQADALIEGVVFSEQLGDAVAGADLDGDGLSDLIVGAPRFPLGGQGTGTVYVFFGPVSGPHSAAEADVVLSGEQLNDEFGTAVAGAGDVNGDGAEDLLVGARQLFREGNGKAYIFHGPLSAGTISAADADAILLGEPPVNPDEEDTFGEAVAAAGDVNGDGYGDVLVSAPENNAGGSQAGRAYLFLGPLAGVIPGEAADLHITGPPQGNLGAAMAGVGDVSGDGADDILVGAPGVFDSGVREFAAVFFGEASVTVSVDPVDPPVVIPATGGSFRFTVTVTNATAEPHTVEAWTAVTGPANREPVLGPKTVTLPPGAALTRTLTQRVPGAAPAGTYTYAVHVGAFPAPAVASDAFTLTKEGASPAMRGDGVEWVVSGWSVSGWSVSGVERWDEAVATGATSELPGGFALSEVHPNPFGRQARLTLEVADGQHVRAEVYDGLGRRVAVLLDGAVEAGAHALAFDGSALPAGVYVVRVTGEASAATRRATLLR